MAELAPPLAAIDTITPSTFARCGSEGPTEKVGFASPILDFFKTDPISRASVVMGHCSAIRTAAACEATGTHG
jgi:NADH-quinone oxidoreductase subunit G